MSKLDFGAKGDAEQLLEQAKNALKLQGQTLDTTKLDKAQSAIATAAAENDITEAAAFCEEIIKFLNAEWNAREFTVEQRVFSIALATVNLRQHLPEERGGKELFDAVSKTAWEYFKKNS